MCACVQTANEVFGIDSDDSDDYEADVTGLSQINLNDVDSEEEEVYSPATISNMKAALERPPASQQPASPQIHTSPVQSNASLLINDSDDASYNIN